MGVFDLLELSASYVQYLVLLLRLGEPSPFPTWYTSPLIALNTLNLDMSEIIDTLREPVRRRDLEGVLPLSLPLDTRLFFFVVGILAPFAYAGISIIILAPKSFVVVYFLAICGFFLTVTGTSFEDLDPPLVDRSRGTDTLAYMFVSGVVILVFCLLCAFYWYLFHGLRVSRRDGTYFLLLQDPISKRDSVETIMRRETKELDWTDIGLRAIFIAVTLILGLTELQVLDIPLFPWLGRLGVFSMIFSAFVLLFSCSCLIYTVALVSEKTRELFWRWSNSSGVFLLSLILLLLTVGIVPVGQTSIQILNCAPSSCPNNYRLPDISESMVKYSSTFDVSYPVSNNFSLFLQSSNVPRYCLPVDTIFTDPSFNRTSCPAEAFPATSSRVHSDRTVKCTDTFRFYFGIAAGFVLVFYVIGNLILQYVLTEQATNQIVDEFPLDAQQSIGLTDEQLLQEKLDQSDNVAKIIFGPFRRDMVYWRVFSLVHRCTTLLFATLLFEPTQSASTVTIALSLTLVNHFVYTLALILLHPYQASIENAVAISTQVCLILVTVTGLGSSTNNNSLAPTGFYVFLALIIILVPLVATIIGYYKMKQEHQEKNEARARRIEKAIEHAYENREEVVEATTTIIPPGGEIRISREQSSDDDGDDDHLLVEGGQQKKKKKKKKTEKQKELERQRQEKLELQGLEYDREQGVFVSASSSADDDDSRSPASTKSVVASPPGITINYDSDDEEDMSVWNATFVTSSAHSRVGDDYAGDVNSTSSFSADGSRVLTRTRTLIALPKFGVTGTRTTNSSSKKERRQPGEEQFDFAQDEKEYNENRKNKRRQERGIPMSRHLSQRFFGAGGDDDDDDDNNNKKKKKNQGEEEGKGKKKKKKSTTLDVSFDGSMTSGAPLKFSRVVSFSGLHHRRHSNNNYFSASSSRRESEQQEDEVEEEEENDENGTRTRRRSKNGGNSTNPLSGGGGGSRDDIDDDDDQDDYNSSSQNDLLPENIRELTARGLLPPSLHDLALLKKVTSSVSDYDNNNNSTGQDFASGNSLSLLSGSNVLNNNNNNTSNSAPESRTSAGRGRNLTVSFAEINHNNNDPASPYPGSYLSSSPASVEHDDDERQEQEEEEQQQQQQQRQHEEAAAFAVAQASVPLISSQHPNDLTSRTSMSLFGTTSNRRGGESNNSNNNSNNLADADDGGSSYFKSTGDHHIVFHVQEGDEEMLSDSDLSVSTVLSSIRDDDNDDDDIKNHHHGRRHVAVETFGADDVAPHNNNNNNNNNDSNDNNEGEEKQEMGLPVFSNTVPFGSSKAIRTSAKEASTATAVAAAAADDEEKKTGGRTTIDSKAFESFDPRRVSLVLSQDQQQQQQQQKRDQNRLTSTTSSFFRSPVNSCLSSGGASTMMQSSALGKGARDAISIAVQRSRDSRAAHRSTSLVPRSTSLAKDATWRDPLRLVAPARRKIWKDRTRVAERIIQYRFLEPERLLLLKKQEEQKRKKNKRQGGGGGDDDNEDDSAFLLRHRSSYFNFSFSDDDDENNNKKKKKKKKDKQEEEKPSAKNNYGRTVFTHSNPHSQRICNLWFFAINRVIDDIVLASIEKYLQQELLANDPAPLLCVDSPTQIVQRAARNKIENKPEASHPIRRNQQQQQEQSSVSNFAKDVEQHELEEQEEKGGKMRNHRLPEELQEPSRKQAIPLLELANNNNNNKDLDVASVAAGENLKRRKTQNNLLPVLSHRTNVNNANNQPVELLREKSSAYDGNNNNNNNNNSNSNSNNRGDQNPDEEEERKGNDDDETIALHPLEAHPSLVIRLQLDKKQPARPHHDSSSKPTELDENNKDGGNNNNNMEERQRIEESLKEKNRAWNRALLGQILQNHSTSISASGFVSNTASFIDVGGGGGGSVVGGTGAGNSNNPQGNATTAATAAAGGGEGTTTTSLSDVGGGGGDAKLLLPPSLQNKRIRELLAVQEALSQPITSAKQEKLIRTRIKKIYTSHLHYVKDRQESTDYRVNRNSQLSLRIFFCILGYSSLIALAFTALGLALTQRDERSGNGAFLPPSGAETSANEFQYHFLSKPLDGADLVLAGYTSWTAFTSHCCCTAFANATLTDAKTVEKWLCARPGVDGGVVVKERLRETKTVSSLSSVRGLCDTEFLNNCTVSVGNVLPYYVSLVNCSSNVTAEDQKLW